MPLPRLASRRLCRGLAPIHSILQSPMPLRRRLASTIAETVAAPSSSQTTRTPPPSFLSRAAKAAGLAVVFTTIGFGLAVAPSRESLSFILQPPSDSDTLTMFSPTSPDAAEKEAFLNTHPLAVSLRQNPDFVESRPHMKMPPRWRAQNLTSGTLMGPGKVVVPPLAFSERGGKSFVQMCHVGTDLCGHVGIVHGGFIATMLDEGLARCCFAALPHNIGMTARLEIDYKAPAAANQYLVLKARTTKVEGRKAWVEGRLETLPASPDEEPVVLATATALFISPRQAAVMAKMYPVTKQD